MRNLWQDVRFGVRMLRKNPGFTFVAILTLAFGIGASTAIFSVVDTVLLRSLPFPHPAELVAISARIAAYDIPYLPLSYPDFVESRSTSSSFSALATYGQFGRSSPATTSRSASRTSRFRKISSPFSGCDHCMAGP
jgi:putative ABC transport system permease protein